MRGAPPSDIFHDVQDALLTKIKETGEAGFTVPELARLTLLPLMPSRAN